MTPEQRAAVVAEAKTWLGTPYHHGAGVKRAGVDCAYLLIRVFHACGLVPAIDPGYYPADWMLHRSEERYLGELLKHADKVDAPQPGDVAIYQFGRCASHGAIVVDWPTIIHSHKLERGVVLADGTAGELTGRLIGFYSLRAA